MSFPVEINKVLELRNSLLDLLVDRENEITAVLTGLLANEPVILVGMPGTAKTMLIDYLCDSIHAKSFKYQINRFTEPDEIFGVLDIIALRQGEYRRITSVNGIPYLPEADIVYLDEIFKASSAIRNTLLRALQEREVIIGATKIKLKAIAFYFSSNEISTDAEDMAFYDRLTIRDFHKYVSSDSWRELIERGIEAEFKVPERIMSLDEVRKVQEFVKERYRNVVKNKTIIDKYLEALMELKERGIEISDRRKLKILKVTSAISVLYLEKDISKDSLADALKFCAVHTEDDIRRVEDVIQKCQLSEFYKEVEKIRTVTTELRQMLEQAKTKGDMESLRAVSLIKKKALMIVRDLPRNPRLMPYVKQLRAVVDETVKFIDKKKRELFAE